MFPVECNGINQQDQKAQILPSRSAHEDRMDFHHCDAGAADHQELRMSNTNTGGPAFPTQVASYEGMTLRDYFAAHATEEDICTAMDLVKKVEQVRDLDSGHKVIERGYPDNTRQLARYIHADAMLKARDA